MTELLKDLILIPEHVHKGDFVLKLTEGVAEDRAEATLKNYVVTTQLVDCFDDALKLIKSVFEPPPTSKAAYLHGSFGSGKSHFMAVLHLLLQGHRAARKHPKLQPLLVKHKAWLAGKKFLLVPYHMIDAYSLEAAVLGGYVEYVRKLHPHAPLPAGLVAFRGWLGSTPSPRWGFGTTCTARPSSIGHAAPGGRS